MKQTPTTKSYLAWVAEGNTAEEAEMTNPLDELIKKYQEKLVVITTAKRRSKKCL